MRMSGLLFKGQASTSSIIKSTDANHITMHVHLTHLADTVVIPLHCSVSIFENKLSFTELVNLTVKTTKYDQLNFVIVHFYQI